MNLLRALRYFVTVVEEEHFGHAADRLDMTQPPLSQGIKRLEAHLGVRLLDRGPNGVSPTDAGAALLAEARGMLAAEDRIRALALTLSDARPALRLGVDPALPDALTAAMAAGCAEDSSEEVHITTEPTRVIIDDVQRHALDLGAIVHPSVTDDLDGSEVHRLPTWLLLPANAAARQSERKSTLRNLLSLPLAVRPREEAPAAHDLLVDTLLEHGCRHGTQPIADRRTALAMVATGRICALTADRSVQAPGVVGVPVPGDVLPLRVRIVWRASSPPEVRAAAERAQRELAAISRSAVKDR